MDGDKNQVFRLPFPTFSGWNYHEGTNLEHFVLPVSKITIQETNLLIS